MNQVDATGERTRRRWEFYECTSPGPESATKTYAVLMGNQEGENFEKGVRQVWYTIGNTKEGEVPPYLDSTADTGIKFDLD